jgi:hypothetical protein
VQGRRGDEGRGESVKLGGAGVVIMVVGAGRTYRMYISVHQEKGGVSTDEQDGGGEPAELGGKFGNQAEYGDAQEHARAEWYDYTRTAAQSG